MAVYTHLSKEDIAAFLLRYPVGVLLSAEGIAEGISNSNYLLRISDGRGEKRYILTIFESRTNLDDLPFFMQLTTWLADRVIPCPRPVRGRNGGTVYWIKDRPAALVEFLEGRNNPAITPQHLILVGEMMARMHYAAESFPMVRRNGLSLHRWHELFALFRHRADEICPGLEKLIADELMYLEKYWPSALPAGVIHADMFPDNIFFTPASGEGELRISGVIDFYYACNDFWIYDLLIAMNAWCFDDAWHFRPERAAALFISYQQQRMLTPTEKMAMPVLARAAALRFLVTRAHDWLLRSPGAILVPKNPMEYVAKLRFHQQAGDWQRFIL